MSEPIKPVEAPIAEVEKELCKCGKMISKKNIAVHLKTAAHLKACPSEEKDGEQKKEVAGKIKERFDSIDTKLELLLELVDEIHEELFADDELDDIPEAEIPK